MYDLGAGGVKIGDLNSSAHPNGERPGYPRNEKKTSGGNVISDNHMRDIGRGLMCDTGCIYTLGGQPGTVLRKNLWHDVTRYEHPFGHGAWGIYLDSASSNILVENNVVYRARDGAFHNQYGQENLIRNNTFALGRRAQILRTRLAEQTSFTFERNIVYRKEGPLLWGAAPAAGRRAGTSSTTASTSKPAASRCALRIGPWPNGSSAARTRTRSSPIRCLPIRSAKTSL
jgi:parallel beta-helix repeat protein